MGSTQRESELETLRNESPMAEASGDAGLFEATRLSKASRMPEAERPRPSASVTLTLTGTVVSGAPACGASTTTFSAEGGKATTYPRELAAGEPAHGHQAEGLATGTFTSSPALSFAPIGSDLCSNLPSGLGAQTWIAAPVTALRTLMVIWPPVAMTDSISKAVSSAELLLHEDLAARHLHRALVGREPGAVQPAHPLRSLHHVALDVARPLELVPQAALRRDELDLERARVAADVHAAWTLPFLTSTVSRGPASMPLQPGSMQRLASSTLPLYGWLATRSSFLNERPLPQRLPAPPALPRNQPALTFSSSATLVTRLNS